MTPGSIWTTASKFNVPVKISNLNFFPRIFRHLCLFSMFSFQVWCLLPNSDQSNSPAGCKTRFSLYDTYLPLHSRRIYFKWPKFIYLWYLLCFESSWSHPDYSINGNIYTRNTFTLSYPKYCTLYRGFPH